MVTALAGVFLAAQVSGLVHDGFAEHVTCDDHGEQIHVGHGGATTTLSSHGRVGEPVPTEHDEHGHCGYVSSTRDEYVAGAGSALVPTPDQSELAGPAVNVRVAVSQGAYRYAPKQSPPNA